jgi:hypothetical protein
LRLSRSLIKRVEQRSQAMAGGGRLSRRGGGRSQNMANALPRYKGAASSAAYGSLRRALFEQYD